jgi:hypothetical protein
MRRSYVVPMRWVVIYEHEVPGGALKLSSAKLLRPWSPCDLPLQGKIPMAEPGIEPRTYRPVVRNSNHQTTRLVCYKESNDSSSYHYAISNWLYPAVYTHSCWVTHMLQLVTQITCYKDKAILMRLITSVSTCRVRKVEIQFISSGIVNSTCSIPFKGHRNFVT